MNQSAPADDSTIARALDDVLTSRSIPMLYQPLVDLERQETVGFEALARPASAPEGGSAVTITDLQSAAVANGTIGELDWICRTAALTNSRVSQLPAELTWLVNAEPAALTSDCPADLAQRLATVSPGVRVVTEVTERALDDDPIRLFRGVRAIRGRGEGIAIDDVGVNPASLALLPLIAPDLVKLDISLSQSFSDPSVSRVCGAIRCLTEHRAAAIVAEGIETPRHLKASQMFGATYGQGFRLGRATALPTSLPTPSRPVTMNVESLADDRTPFEVLAAERTPVRATKDLLVPLTSYLEGQVGERSEPLAMFTTFEDPKMLTPQVQEKYVGLAERYAFVAMFSSRLPRGLPGLVNPQRTDGDDRLQDEWNVLVIGPHYAAALSARSLRDTGPDASRRYDYVLTHDRALVERAARALIERQTRPPR